MEAAHFDAACRELVIIEAKKAQTLRSVIGAFMSFVRT
jgi:hypothetical protein